MSTSQPLKNKDDIQKLKNYFYEKGEYRNYALVSIGLNTALRISDILNIRWNEVYNVSQKCFYSHIRLCEQKTQKETQIILNQSAQQALALYMKHLPDYNNEDFIFKSGRDNQKHLSRMQAFRIIRDAAEKVELEIHLSCHSLRKTFGYQAWKEGTEPALLMDVFNHSSYSITKRYLCIDQDDKDELFSKINL